MGGYGSGRKGWKGKVESYRSLDCQPAQQAGCLQPGYRGGWGGRPTASRRQHRSGRYGEPAAPAIQGASGWWGLDAVELVVPLARSPCRFGGGALISSARGEERRGVQPSREQALPRPPTFSVPPLLRPSVRAKLLRLPAFCAVNKHKIALGGTPGPICFRRSRKGWHQRTYERHLAEIAAAEDQGDLALIGPTKFAKSGPAERRLGRSSP